MATTRSPMQYINEGMSKFIRCPCEDSQETAFGNLHQEKIEIYPENEDQPLSVALSIPASGGKLIAETIPIRKPNPSARRQGIRITFWCEHCDRRPELCISQHKGNTEIGWDIDTF